MRMLPLPEKFVARVLCDLGEAEGRALCEALDGKPPVSVRLNPAKLAAGGETGGCSAADMEISLRMGAGCGAAAEPALRFGADDRGGVEPGRRSAGDGADGRVGMNTPDALCLPFAALRAAGHCGAGEEPPAGAEACMAEHAEKNGDSCVEPGIRHDRCPEASRQEFPCEDADGAGPLPAAWRIPWSAWGYYLPGRPSFTLDPEFHAGAYYVQEAGSQFVGHLLAGEDIEGKRVLDLCAAPGGKTTLYASLAGPDGLVVANEIDRRRAQVLADNVRKWGTGNVAVTVCEPQQLGAFEAWFDVVAVDAPCSGEGMFRKDEGARAEWSEENVRMCAVRQAEILREAWRVLKPGGLLIYSTCTFNRPEDEEVLEAFTGEQDGGIAEAEAVEVDPAWGVICGCAGAFRTFRFYPHKARGEGFFAAVARKSDDAVGRVRTPKARRVVFSSVTRDEIRELSRWVVQPGGHTFMRVGDVFYAYPAAQAVAVKTLSEALPVICSGVEMGQIFKGTLKPAHALALYAGFCRGVIPEAALDGAQALAYLRRQELPVALFAEGMNLVTCRGRALGFAKRIGGRVNNLYPNSLKIIKS